MEYLSDAGQARDFSNAIYNLMSGQPVHEFKDPSVGQHYAKRTLRYVPIPPALGQSLAYGDKMDGKEIRLQPSQANITTIYPLNNDTGKTKAAVRLAWEFDPTGALERNELVSGWEAAAARRGHVTNMWREGSNDIGVERATAFKPAVPSQEILEIKDHKAQLAYIQEVHAQNGLLANEAAWGEAELLGPVATFQEADLIINFIRSLSDQR